jgi:hypothetical protein
MKLNNNLLIGAALVGGGAYYAYKKGLFGKIFKSKSGVTPADLKSPAATDAAIKTEQTAVKTAKVDAAKVAKAVTAATAVYTASSYKGKVAFIQSDLGVAVDGIAGNQTNMAYNAKYGLDRGQISEANVDYYKSKVTQGLTLVKQAQVAKQTNGVAVVNALKNGGTIRFIKTINAQNFILNKATNSYVATGTNLLFNNGAVLSSTWRAIDRGAGFVLIYKAGANTLQQVPVNAIVVV